jgi:hypothetical protein
MRHEIIPSLGVRVRRRDLLTALLITTAVSALRADDAGKLADVQASEGSSVFPSATWEEYSGINEPGFTPDGVTSVALVPDSYIDSDPDAEVARLAGIVIGIALLEPVLAAFHVFTWKSAVAAKDDTS